MASRSVSVDEMNIEEGTQQLNKGLQETTTQSVNAESLNQAEAPFRTSRSGPQQKCVLKTLQSA